MHPKITQTAYLLGISLLLTSIVYFFSANWPYFTRINKVILALLLVVLFYVVHFSLKRWITWQPFLSNWALIAASIVFGIAVALIGQVYNSHADSYMLFFVWFIPVLLLTIITKYAPLYVMGYVLSQLTMVFFIFPSGLVSVWDSHVKLMLIFGMLIFNVIVFTITYHPTRNSRTIFYLSYILSLGLGLYITIDEGLPFHIGWNILFISLCAGAIYGWYAMKPQKSLLTITIIAASLFVTYRVFYWVLDHYGELILYLLLLFAIVLTIVGAFIVSLLNKKNMNRYLANTITISITMLTTIFAVAAISGLFFLLFPGAADNTLYIFALVVLILPGLFAKLPSQFRYSLLGTGFLLAFLTSSSSGEIYHEAILLIPLCIGIYTIKQPGIKVLTYTMTNVVASFLFAHYFSAHMVALILFVLNATYYLYIIKERATNYTAFLIAALSGLYLTVMDISITAQVLYNVLFLFGVPVLLFVLYKNGRSTENSTLFIIWFLFLGYKYYEYLWTLLHKSIIALVLGLIFITVAYFFDRPNKTNAPTGFPIPYRTSYLIVVIILQISFIGWQSFTSEKVLQEGDRIKLSLEPVDPRSLLQGDYVALHYDINHIDEAISYGKVKVVLRPAGDTYEYAGYYKNRDTWNTNYTPEAGDIIINGKARNGGNIQYGIESYFVPEGSGRDLERDATFAYVRVSKTGNAIVEKVE